MKLQDIDSKFSGKFDSLGNPILTEAERDLLGIIKISSPELSHWYRFECHDCGYQWKARARPDRAKSCLKCSSLSVKRERLGNGKREGSHQKKPESKKITPPIAQISIHLNNRRKEFIEAYNRDPSHRVELKVDA
jgi:hypothetical protein